ncbi:MAG: UDP-N-acetylmuramate: L-alanyl-gamma-D-glutamyl-meso-diaminopimelate ligase [Motiliproteus sp.]|jgi:UDP-N-acetylmuramate: L-alanyl-gamma-D-glutamyl-meso-diaminopimelate ligase
MHLHILGICGTFMGSLALLAKARGFRVSGCDANVYPPMSTQLAEQGIELLQGYKAEHLQPRPDLVIIGNALSRGNPCVEQVLNDGIPYCSGPQWLADEILQDKWVLAVAGTHGKTTTSSMLAWVLEHAGMAPGFLIGGVPSNFGLSARLGDTPFFVIEADEYDTAFFDKRSKFVHYRPRTAILNNLEFDHADIFDDLAAIERQFHHLVRTIPANGQIITAQADSNLTRVLEQGCWTPVIGFGLQEGEWQARLLKDDGSAFEVMLAGQPVATVRWDQTGLHSVLNGLAAMAAARHVGVTPEHSAEALSLFAGVKRRMERIGIAAGITLYDDFAHHPTAIDTTLQGLRARAGAKPVLAIIEPRSNSMRLGCHRQALAPSTKAASEVFWYQPTGLNWDLDAVVAESPVPARVFNSVDAIIEAVKAYRDSDAEVVIMSNGGFEGIQQRLLTALQALDA